MSEYDEARKILREVLGKIPARVESEILNPKVRATDKLKWVGLAIGLFQGPSGRQFSDVDIDNQRKAAQILKDAVPVLKKIQEKHQLERLRNSAAKYLRYIAREVGGDN
jgi:hypothetical protein